MKTRNPQVKFPTPPPTPPEPWHGKLNTMSRATLINLLRHLTFNGQGVSRRAWQIRARIGVTLMALMLTFTATAADQCYNASPADTAKVAAQQNMFRSSGVVKPYQQTTISVQGAKAPVFASAPAGSRTVTIATPQQTRVTTTYANGATANWTLRPGQGNGYVVMTPKAAPATPKPTYTPAPKLGCVKPYQAPVIENRQHTNRSGGGDGTNPGGHGNANGYKNPAGVAKGMPIH